MKAINNEEMRNVTGGGIFKAKTYVMYCPGLRIGECRKTYKDKNGKNGVFKHKYYTAIGLQIAYASCYTSACNCVAEDSGQF